MGVKLIGEHTILILTDYRISSTVNLYMIYSRHYLFIIMIPRLRAVKSKHIVKSEGVLHIPGRTSIIFVRNQLLDYFLSLHK